jgi:hypothetical protein
MWIRFSEIIKPGATKSINLTEKLGTVKKLFHDIL